MKTTRTYHYIPIRMAKKKEEKKKDTDNTKCTEKDKEYYIALFGVQNGIASSAVSFKIKYIIIL